MTANSPAYSAIKGVLPYLRVRRAAEALDFYVRAFGAVEKYRLNEPGSTRIGHAELLFGATTIMLSDEFPEMKVLGPESLSGTTATILLEVESVDAMAERAVAAGATILRPPTDEFYGERSCKLRDPFGHEWMLGQPIEAVSPEEMQRRYDEMCK